MMHIGALLIGFLIFTVSVAAADLSTASLQDLLDVYKQLRTIQGGGDSALTENIVFKRDAATFTFVTGRITFAAPVAGCIIAAQFEGNGQFELEPPSPMDKYQISRFTGSSKLVDAFSEAVFYFTDDTYAEISKLIKVQPAPSTAQVSPFASSQKQYSEVFNGWVDNRREGNPTMRNLAARILADLTDGSSKGFFLAHFKGKKSGDLLFHISWNRDPLFFPEHRKGEEVFLLHVNPGNYYEWWS